MASRPPQLGSRFGRSPKDLLTGLMFMAIGALGLWIGADYPRGTPVRPGTGVFPSILCWGLVAIGAILFMQGVLTSGPPVGRIAWRPVILIPLAAASFSFLIEPAGLVVAMIVLMTLARFAGSGHSNKEFAIFTIIMLLMGVGIFIWGLEMPLKVFPWS